MEERIRRCWNCGHLQWVPERKRAECELTGDPSAPGKNCKDWIPHDFDTKKCRNLPNKEE